MNFKIILIFISGLYLGKYYPQYVPIPKLNKENVDKVLTKLNEMDKKL